MSGIAEISSEPRDSVVAGNAKPPRSRSLKTVMLHGSSWTMIEYGGSQVLRLASNFILARFVDPSAYGVMAIVMVFTQALDMFSDVGIGPSIVQHKRGDEKAFLNTAWTIQVVRGITISLCATIIAWPVSRTYGAHVLLYAIPVAALSATIGGFNSMNLLLLNRHVKLARLALINLGTQAIAIVGTVAVAYFTRNVWALIAGAILSSLVKLIAGHLFCPGPRHAFAWDRAATIDLFHFGKWIFFSTLFGFLASKGDQVVLGWYMTSKAEFGLYFIAATLSGALVNGVHTISSRVLFPVYARLANEKPEALRRQTFRIRLILVLLTIPPVCVLAIWGREIVHLLYREEYYDAGWMLQILAMGAVVSVIGSTVGPVLLAVGDSYRFMIIQISRTIIMCCTMAICGYIGLRSGIANGAHIGVIAGVALPELFLYPILVWAVRRYGVWLPKLDIPAFIAAALVIAAGLSL